MIMIDAHDRCAVVIISWRLATHDREIRHSVTPVYLFARCARITRYHARAIDRGKSIRLSVILSRETEREREGRREEGGALSGKIVGSCDTILDEAMMTRSRESFGREQFEKYSGSKFAALADTKK